MHCNCYNDTMKTLLAVLGVLLGSTVFPAFAAPTVPLDSGAILEETKRSPTARPPQPDAPALRIDEPRPDEALDDVQTIPVSAFRLSGELPPGVPADELQALLAGEAGRSHTLKSLAGVTQRLTRHLRERGYLLAFAYLPAQEIKNGEVAMPWSRGVTARCASRATQAASATTSFPVSSPTCIRARRSKRRRSNAPCCWPTMSPACR
jgi:hemolysin activation/secretion protein